jgi:D,D-heptose 1,7-bisphosphate phosphatase
MSLRQCAILVGGRGTRLGKFTQQLPKPLLPVGGCAFLDYIVAQVSRRGFDRFICLAGYQADAVRNWAQAARRPDVRIDCVVEPKPMGTAGALVAAADLLDDEFLLLNGDSYFDIDLGDFVAWQPAGPWVGSVAVRSMADTGRYGVVRLSGDVISTFADRPASGCSGLINGGIYRLKRQVLDFVGSVPCSIEKDVFPMLAARGLLRGRPYDGFFLDIGTTQAYEAAQTLLPAVVRQPALFLDRDGVVNKDIGHAHRPDQIEWVEGIFDAVKAANAAGVYVFVVTNQAGVARGLYDEAAVVRLHQWMAQEFRTRGTFIDDFAYCPHHPSAGNGPYTRSCTCRKPAPGMLLELAGKRPVDLSRSLLIGDKDTDLQAARSAGVDGLLYRSGSVLELVHGWLAACREDARKLHQHHNSNPGCLPDVSDQEEVSL